jgi:hypothetical protein
VLETGWRRSLATRKTSAGNNKKDSPEPPKAVLINPPG